MALTAMQLNTVPRSVPSDVRPLLPIELLDCPESAGFGPLHNGVLMALCKAFWRSGCTLGEGMTDSDWLSIAGCHSRRWQIVRVPVLRAFHALRPKLSTVYAKTARSMALRFAASSKGGMLGSRVRNGKDKLSDSHSDVAPLLPRTEKISVSTMTRGKPATLSDAAE